MKKNSKRLWTLTKKEKKKKKKPEKIDVINEIKNSSDKKNALITAKKIVQKYKSMNQKKHIW